MPKGHATRREAKKPKKKDDKKAVSAPIFTSEEVEVTGKRRKSRDRET